MRSAPSVSRRGARVATEPRPCAWRAHDEVASKAPASDSETQRLSQWIESTEAAQGGSRLRREATRGRRSGPWCEAGVVTGCCGRWGRVTGVLRRGREEPRASPAENWRRRCARLWRWGAASPHPALLRETPWEGARRLLRRAQGPAPHGHVAVTSRRLGDTCVGPTHKTPSGTSGSRPASALAVAGVAETSVSGG